MCSTSTLDFGSFITRSSIWGDCLCLKMRSGANRSWTTAQSQVDAWTHMLSQLWVGIHDSSHVASSPAAAQEMAHLALCWGCASSVAWAPASGPAVAAAGAVPDEAVYLAEEIYQYFDSFGYSDTASHCWLNLGKHLLKQKPSQHLACQITNKMLAQYYILVTKLLQLLPIGKLLYLGNHFIFTSWWMLFIIILDDYKWLL